MVRPPLTKMVNQHNIHSMDAYMYEANTTVYPSTSFTFGDELPATPPKCHLSPCQIPRPNTVGSHSWPLSLSACRTFMLWLKLAWPTNRLLPSPLLRRRLIV